MSRRDDLRKQIANHRRRLQKLEEQQALYGLDTPPHVMIEIEDIRAKIEELRAELRALEERGVEPVPEIAPLVSASRTIPLQRPSRAVHFAGREEELAQLMADLQPGRVVTLCGPGGVGKTALAAEAIWTLTPGNEPPERFPDGILFHSFYTQPETALALEAIARAYGEEPRPSPRDAARRVLAGRRALLVLDGAENADDLGAVLEVVGGCGVLVTSRRHEDAPDHTGRCDVAPLPNPEAVQLLQAWGGKRATDEAAARRICELVGGLPLAVRLAGRYLAQREEEAADYLAWLEETPLRALDHGERQRDSVPLLLERSLAQVSEGAQAALAVVGILALAPFGREAVAAALDTSVTEVGRTLGKLVNYGLLVRNEERYQASHALVYTYARRRLAPPVEAIERLAAHYDAFAREQRALGLTGYAALDPERPHLMATLAGCETREDWKRARSLAWSIERYLLDQLHWNEWAIAIQVGLEAARTLGDRRNEGLFLGGLATICALNDENEQAIEYHKQALAIAHEIGDRRMEGGTLICLAGVYEVLKPIEKAIEYYRQALAIAREIGDRGVEGWSLNGMGSAYRRLGQAELAIEYHKQALAFAQEIGDRDTERWVLTNLAFDCCDLEQVGQAIEYYKQALAMSSGIGDRLDELLILSGLTAAYLSPVQAKEKQARDALEQALAILEAVQSPDAEQARNNLAKIEGDE